MNQGLADPADALLSLESSMEEADLTSGELSKSYYTTRGEKMN